MNGPLDGMRVVDWTIFQQGPVAASMLGDLGAEVIKIEELGKGDPGRGLRTMTDATTALARQANFYFETNNRNKKSLVLDLKKPGAKEIIYRLVERSDIFVQNFRPGVAERLGLDYDTLSKLNPRLIYAQGSGYGILGPESTRPALDPVGLARSGFMNSLVVGDGSPPYPPGGISDQTVATMLAYGVLAAVVARERFGVGQKVDCSQISGMMWLQSLSIHTLLTLNRAPPPWCREAAANPLWNCYRCADGKWFFLSLGQADRHWPALIRAIQRPELENDPRFVTSVERRENCREIIAILDEVFAAKSYQEWRRILSEDGNLIFESINSFTDLIDDPQVIANNYIVDFEHPSRGTVKMVNLPVTLSKTPGSIRAPAPEYGQHTEETLVDICGYTWDEVAKFREEQVI